MDRLGFFQSIAVPALAFRAHLARGRFDADRRVRVSLRDKGVVALALLVLYGICVGLFVGHERAKLLHIVQQVDRIHADTESLVKVDDHLIHSVVALQIVLASDDYAGQRASVDLDVTTLLPDLARLAQQFPSTASSVSLIEQRWDDSKAEWSLRRLAALRDTEQELAAQIKHLEQTAEARSADLFAEYRNANRRLTVEVSVLNFTGLALFGAAMIWFLSRLAADIKTVEARATAIVGGYRGPSLEVTRGDEVGGLIDSINRIQSELSARERAQELSRQRRFHQEKMAAVGSLAAAVAHEVNNPINSISGIAQYTIETIRNRRRLPEETLRRNAELTLQQTERLAAIVRHLADMGAPRSREPELLDLNALLDSTCSLIRYDPRFRNIDLSVAPDPSIPSVRAVADHLVQVLMNLLINAADSMADPRSARRVIHVETRVVNSEIRLSVADSGRGMEPSVLARVFDEFFTTKPAAAGRGIGLYLSRTLMVEMGGSIDLQSTPGIGTTAIVRLPIVLHDA